MGYMIKAVLGAALFFGGVALFNVKLVDLLEAGTCASGNVPYEIAPGYQCPDDTGTDILLMTAGILGGLIGAGLFAFPGEPPWGSGERGGIIVGATFLVMGIPALLISLWGFVKSLGGRGERPALAGASVGGGG